MSELDNTWEVGVQVGPWPIRVLLCWCFSLKKLYENIEVLTNSLNEQAEIIKKHENIINNLLETVQKLISNQQVRPQNSQFNQQPNVHPQNSQFNQQPNVHPQNSKYTQQHQVQYKNSQFTEAEPQNIIQHQDNPKVIFEEPQQIFAFQFMQKPLNVKNSHKVEEIIPE